MEKTAEISCPQCKSNSYINPGLKVFVSPCYHSLCEMCVSMLFANGPNKCPECHVSLRRSNYTSQTFEDICIERECRVRKMISLHIGKSLDDFSDEEEYNEYLEEVEELVEELVELKGPREISARLQELKEKKEPAPILKKEEHSQKKRKVEEQEALFTKLNYFFPPSAIDPDTLPASLFPKDYQERVPEGIHHFRESIKVMIQKVSRSLTQEYISIYNNSVS
ncbi:CDK-activating kinase assembly factor MAT1 [Nematocida sp. LUAm3]|nr:CDK-activating kinase assembly factor MAT1 [Nematocida sp. LUAm3]KAI5174695.1 CDK-activating kinase assembly factor MAT1 [Nematocida sp. LUAm2]KAI5177894.1 CDK-activating kinase assembly factor MAT1 [Nematocida sp. LUAm1]